MLYSQRFGGRVRSWTELEIVGSSPAYHDYHDYRDYDRDYHDYHDHGNYTATTMRGNFSRYSYPMESQVTLTYVDGDYTINNHDVNIVKKCGVVTPPLLLQKILSSASKEPFQICYDFSTERTGLKITVAFLALLFLTSGAIHLKTPLKKYAEINLENLENLESKV